MKLQCSEHTRFIFLFYFILFYFYYPFCICIHTLKDITNYYNNVRIFRNTWVFCNFFIHVINFNVFRPHPCRSGLPQSRGYGFVEFQHHTHALACLRELNNNPAHGKFATTGTVLCTRCSFFLKTFSYFVF